MDRDHPPGRHRARICDLPLDLVLWLVFSCWVCGWLDLCVARCLEDRWRSRQGSRSPNCFDGSGCPGRLVIQPDC